MSNKAGCKERIYSGEGFHGHMCTRNAKPDLDGYCIQHYPPNVKKRRAAASAKMDAEIKAKFDRQDAAKAAREAKERKHVAMEKALHDIQEQATRHQRATGMKPYLLRDLEMIAAMAEKGMA